MANRHAQQTAPETVAEDEGDQVPLRNDGEPVRQTDTQTGQEPTSGGTAGGVRFWETGMALSAGVEFTARGRVDGPFTEDEACRLTAPIRMRQVGWLDQKGRVWLECPPAGQFDGGSLTPLLVQVSYDD